MDINKLTKTQIERLAGRQITDNQFKDLLDCLARFQINTKKKVCHFLAQVMHESGGLKWTEELSTGAAYENRADLGNTFPGDGRRYKGAGYLQLTGRNNYQALADYLKDDKIMEGHKQVATWYPWTSAGFWWQANRMNILVNSGATCRQISAKVNGKDPANGLEDRERYFKRALDIIDNFHNTEHQHFEMTTNGLAL